MFSERSLRKRIDEVLQSWVEQSLQQLESVGDELVPVADAARSFLLDGGKRLRPQFCFWGAVACGGDDDESLVRAATSLELVQACALAHDDLIDHSDTRRGKPSLHRRFEALHGASGWSGSAENFGAASAILLGDLFLLWSDAMLDSAWLSVDARARAMPVWHEMRAEVMAGQYLDLVEQAAASGSVDRALRVAQLKAGRYTVERPLSMGAAIADGKADAVAALRSFGVDVGVAFQLRDDLLGVFGDPALTGKPAGDDLREGKRTVLVAVALQAADDRQRSTIAGGLGRDLADDEVQEIREVLRATEADVTVEAMIGERLDRAVSVIDAAPIDDDARAALRALAALSAQRAR